MGLTSSCHQFTNTIKLTPTVCVHNRFHYLKHDTVAWPPFSLCRDRHTGIKCQPVRKIQCSKISTHYDRRPIDHVAAGADRSHQRPSCLRDVFTPST